MCCVRIQGTVKSLVSRCGGDEDDCLLAFQFGNCSTITGSTGADEDDCVEDAVVESVLTWVTLSLLFGSFLVRNVLDKRYLYCKLANNVALRVRSLIIAFLFELQYEGMLCQIDLWSTSMNIPLSTYSSETRSQRSAMFSRVSTYLFGIIFDESVKRRILTSISGITSSVAYNSGGSWPPQNN